MKGCFSLIIKTVIAVLVFFGLLHLGVIDYIKDKISEYQSPSQEQMIEKTKDMLDLSKINDEYAIEKNIELFKNRMIIAKHNASEQQIIMIEPSKDDILTKEDIENPNLQSKIEQAVNKYKYKLIKFDKVEVVKRGEFNGLNQRIPYAKIKAEISNLPIKDVEGIVASAKLENGKDIIIIAINEKGKYSQIITDSFFSNVK